MILDKKYLSQSLKNTKPQGFRRSLVLHHVQGEERRMSPKYSGWIAAILEQYISIHCRWDIPEQGRSWKIRYTGWHKIYWSSICPAYGSDPVQIILWDFFLPIMKKWFIRSELLLDICSAPELISSLHQLPGGCYMTIYPCLAAQSLCLRVKITTATSY